MNSVKKAVEDFGFCSFELIEEEKENILYLRFWQSRQFCRVAIAAYGKEFAFPGNEIYAISNFLAILDIIDPVLALVGTTQEFRDAMNTLAHTLFTRTLYSRTLYSRLRFIRARFKRASFFIRARAIFCMIRNCLLKSWSLIFRKNASEQFEFFVAIIFQVFPMSHQFWSKPQIFMAIKVKLYIKG